jgi:hypothetical protein
LFILFNVLYFEDIQTILIVDQATLDNAKEEAVTDAQGTGSTTIEVAKTSRGRPRRAKTTAPIIVTQDSSSTSKTTTADVVATIPSFVSAPVASPQILKSLNSNELKTRRDRSKNHATATDHDSNIKENAKSIKTNLNATWPSVKATDVSTNKKFKLKLEAEDTAKQPIAVITPSKTPLTRPKQFITPIQQQCAKAAVQNEEKAKPSVYDDIDLDFNSTNSVFASTATGSSLNTPFNVASTRNKKRKWNESAVDAAATVLVSPSAFHKSPNNSSFFHSPARKRTRI